MTSLLRFSLYGLLSLGAAGSSFFVLKPAFQEEAPLPAATLIETREEAPQGIILEDDESALEQLDKEAAKCDATPPVKVAPKPAPTPKPKAKPEPKPKPKATPKPAPKPKPKTTTKKKKKKTTKQATPVPAPQPVIRTVYPAAPYGVPVVPVRQVVYPVPVVPVQRVVYPAPVVPVRRVVYPAPVVPVRRVVYPAPVPVRVVRPYGY